MDAKLREWRHPLGVWFFDETYQQKGNVIMRYETPESWVTQTNEVFASGDRWETDIDPFVFGE